MKTSINQLTYRFALRSRLHLCLLPPTCFCRIKDDAHTLMATKWPAGSEASLCVPGSAAERNAGDQTFGSSQHFQFLRASAQSGTTPVDDTPEVDGHPLPPPGTEKCFRIFIPDGVREKKSRLAGLLDDGTKRKSV